MTTGPRFPSPDEVRGPPLKGSGQKPILWELVDPILMSVSNIKMVSKRLGISRKTLWLRRKELGLAPLPRGGPRKFTLTSREKQAMDDKAAGRKASDAAEARGVSVQAEYSVRSTAQRKIDDIIKDQCRECKGTGTIECDSCRNTGSHQHVCLNCNGNGYHVRS